MENKQKHKDIEIKGQKAYAQGISALEVDNYEEAIGFFTDAISFQLTQINYYIARARCYFQQHQYHKYVFDITLALHIEADNWALLMARAHGFYNLQKYDEAILDLDAALLLYDDQHQSSNRSKTTIGNIHFRKGAAYFQKTLDKSRRTESIKVLYQKAIDDFSETISASENNSQAYSRRAACYLSLKMQDEAIQDFQKAVTHSNVTDFRHINNYKLGEAYLIVGTNQSAVDSFQAAIEDAEAYKKDYDSKQNSRSYKKALQVFDLTKQTEQYNVNGNLVRIMKFVIDETPDISGRIKYKENKPKTEFPEYYASLGKAKALLGHHQEALKQFSKSIEQESNNPQTLYERSIAYRIMGQYKLAMDDIESCAHLMLDSDVAYNKAIILENQGKIDDSLEIYESILAGLFNKEFRTDFLQSFLKEESVIDCIIKQAQVDRQNDDFIELKNQKTALYEHFNSMYHASLLHRQKLNITRAISLVEVCIQHDESDDRLYDLLAMLHYDNLSSQKAIELLDRSELIQQKQKNHQGVNWETYYIRAVCKMKLLKFNAALGDLILSQHRPAGGNSRDMKKQDADLVIKWLTWLPPGSPISTAYYIASGIDSIPKDPLSPSSAARGIQNDLQLVFPLLDLQGALPGFVNHFVYFKKAECLFQLRDFVGCIRSLSFLLKDFNFDHNVKNGMREVTLTLKRIRDNQPIKFRVHQQQSDEENEGSSSQSQQHLPQQQQVILQEHDTTFLTQDQIDIMQERQQQMLNRQEIDLLYNIYFLRSRALFQLNRLAHAVKDCGKAHYIFAKFQEKPESGEVYIGMGNLYYFMSKIYSNLRYYTKAYHCARDAVRSGVPYDAVHRAHYMQGICLAHTGRLEEAIKAFSLAARCHFSARIANEMQEILDNQGLIQLPNLEEIADFFEAHPEIIQKLQIELPIVIELKRKVINDFDQLFDIGKFKVNTDIHRLDRVKPFGTDIVKLNQNHELKKQLITQSFIDSALNQVENKIVPFDDYLLVQNKDTLIRQTQSSQMLRQISNAKVWINSENVHYLHERAKCLQEIGLHEMAVDDFTTVIRIQRDNPRAYFRRAFSLKSLGMFNEAAIDFKKARDLDPTNGKFQIDFERISQIGYIEIVPHGNEEFYEKASDWAQKVDLDEYQLNKMYFETNTNVGKICRYYDFSIFSQQQVFDLMGMIGHVEDVPKEVQQIIEEDKIEEEIKVEVSEAQKYSALLGEHLEDDDDEEMVLKPVK